MSLTHGVKKGMTAKVWWSMISDLRLSTHLQIAVTKSLVVEGLALVNTKINSGTVSKVFSYCEVSYHNLRCYSCFFFSSSIPSLLQRKILFEVLGQSASKQNYNFKHKVPATWISLCLLKVKNSNAIITKKMIKNNNEVSVSLAFLEDWWEKLQSEAVKSWNKNTFITFLKSMHVPETFSNRQCALNRALCW